LGVDNGRLSFGGSTLIMAHLVDGNGNGNDHVLIVVSVPDFDGVCKLKQRGSIAVVVCARLRNQLIPTRIHNRDPFLGDLGNDTTTTFLNLVFVRHNVSGDFEVI